MKSNLKFTRILSTLLLAAALLSACVPNSEVAPDLSNMTSQERWYYHQHKRLSKIAPHFPFSIQKTCDATLARLKSADPRQWKPKSNISLWETHSAIKGGARYILWNEASACGFLIETDVPTGEGPLRGGANIRLSNKNAITAELTDVVVEDIAFEGIYNTNFILSDFDTVTEIYREKFLQCRADTGKSKPACREATQEWVNSNSVNLTLAFSGQKEKENAVLFMIGDRMWWAGREIE